LKKLPALPGMLTRSLMTVNRTGERVEGDDVLTNTYRAPMLSAADLTRYHKMFTGFKSAVPLTYLYTTAQRAHLSEMLRNDFPWPVLGMVHVSNAVEQLAPIEPKAGFVLTITIQLPKPRARILRPEYTVLFQQGDDETLTTVARCHSVYQVMQKQPSKTGESKAPPRVPSGWHSFAPWELNAGLSRDYARLSGDYNPIHLHPLTSRWFGFSQPIIHGMYMAARAHADIERELQQPLRQIDVKFKRPVALPGKVQLHYDGHNTYQLRRDADDQIALEGSFRVVGQ